MHVIEATGRRCENDVSCHIGCNEFCFLHGIHILGACSDFTLDPIIQKLEERNRQLSKTFAHLKNENSVEEFTLEDRQAMIELIKQAHSQLEILYIANKAMHEITDIYVAKDTK
jgi:hypothetical protein